MGIIRGGLVVILSILLLCSLLMMSALWTISSALEYTNIRANLGSSIKDVAFNQMNLSKTIDTNYPLAVASCQNKTEIFFTDEKKLYDFKIPCGAVNQGKEKMIDSAVAFLVNDTYYAEYNCDYWNCLAETGSPAVFLSEKSHNYWQGKFWLAVFVCLILFAILFFAVENKSNAFVLGGILAIISALPFMKISAFVSWFSKETILIKVLSALLLTSFGVFVIIALIGALLILVGILMKSFSFGMEIEEFFEKFGKKKEEEKK